MGFDIAGSMSRFENGARNDGMKAINGLDKSTKTCGLLDLMDEKWYDRSGSSTTLR